MKVCAKHTLCHYAIYRIGIPVVGGRGVAPAPPLLSFFSFSYFFLIAIITSIATASTNPIDNPTTNSTANSDNVSTAMLTISLLLVSLIRRYTYCFIHFILKISPTFFYLRLEDCKLSC